MKKILPDENSIHLSGFLVCGGVEHWLHCLLRPSSPKEEADHLQHPSREEERLVAHSTGQIGLCPSWIDCQHGDIRAWKPNEVWREET